MVCLMRFNLSRPQFKGILLHDGKAWQTLVIAGVASWRLQKSNKMILIFYF